MKKLNILLMTTVALTMAGCGGGGGGGDTSYKPTDVLSNAGNTQTSAAARATPIKGSVIQSSVNSTPNLGVETTKNTLAFKQVAGGQDVALSLSDRIYAVRLPDRDIFITESLYLKSLNNGDFGAVDFFAVDFFADYDTGADDYLSLGFWLYAPNSGGTPEIGFYADGGDPFIQANINGLTGTANYEGEENVFMFYNRNDGNVDFGLADINLVANFNANTISGSISDIEFPYYETAVGAQIALQAASIDTNQEGGFWTGDTLGTTSSGERYTGKWGGQFYGNGATATEHPQWAAGTFGGAAVAGTGAEGTFVGTFAAEKQ